MGRTRKCFVKKSSRLKKSIKRHRYKSRRRSRSKRGGNQVLRAVRADASHDTQAASVALAASARAARQRARRTAQAVKVDSKKAERAVQADVSKSKNAAKNAVMATAANLGALGRAVRNTVGSVKSAVQESANMAMETLTGRPK